MIDLYAIIKEACPTTTSYPQHVYSIFKLRRVNGEQLRWVEMLNIKRSRTLEEAQEQCPEAIYLGEFNEWKSSYPFKESHLSEIN